MTKIASKLQRVNSDYRESTTVLIADNFNAFFKKVYPAPPIVQIEKQNFQGKDGFNMDQGKVVTGLAVHSRRGLETVSLILKYFGMNPEFKIKQTIEDSHRTQWAELINSKINTRARQFHDMLF